MASGIKVDDSVVTAYNDFRRKKLYKFITFKISDDEKSIVVDEQGGDHCGGYCQFEEVMRRKHCEQECRYGVVVHNYVREGGPRSKICFVTFVPEHAKIKKKMLYTSSKQELRHKLDGAEVEVQATDMDEVDEKCIQEIVDRKFKN